MTDSSHPQSRRSEFGYSEDEMLVAVSHREVVQRALRQLGYSSEVMDEDLDLDLSRLRIDRRDSAVELPGIWGATYEFFAQQYAGWQPTIGKNRIVSPVIGGGEVGFGGAGDPAPVDPPSWWPPRRSGAGRGARVAVLDTAAVTASPLSDGWLDRYSDVRGLGSDAPAFAGHATFVAGLVLSRAPGATVEVRQVLSDENGQANAWDVARAIVAAGKAGADLINLSLVCYTSDARPPMALEHAVSRLDPQIVVVAAAGNYGNHPDDPEFPDVNFRQRPTWPAALPSVIAVGSSTASGARAVFTPPDVPWIDVMTIGEGVDSTFFSAALAPAAGSGAPGGTRDDAAAVEFRGFARWSGTSFSAALLTGEVAARVDGGRISARSALASVLADAQQALVSAPPLLTLR